MLTAIHDFWLQAYQSEHASGSAGWAHALGFLNLFKYITFRAALAGLTAFLISLLIGPRIIRRLISLKVGQPLRTAEEVHKLAELHGGKLGTPTMGGVMIIGSVLAATLLCGRPLNPFVAVCSLAMTACGFLGFCDDFKKVREKKSDGISARAKLGGQITIALAAAAFLYFHPAIGPSGYQLKGQPIGIDAICFPLFKTPLASLGFLAIPFFAFVIVGCSNAVNLTDGLDGLASGCTISTALFYSVIAYLSGHVMAADYLGIPHHPQIGELAVFLMALAGACFGFLWFNCQPAKVFMGDTGSLAIGGALATAAICSRQELMLVIVGGIFVMEALSVVLQVGSFKLRKKRIFRMSPIHHHFELLGWKESQVVIRFWILSIMLALCGLALLKVA